MSLLKDKLFNSLKDLKENYNITGVKSEFETEGATFEEAQTLKELASSLNLEFTLKIGGCGAIKDLYDAKKLGADNIVAPMIESEYALKKYIEGVGVGVNGVNIGRINPKNYPIKKYINIETITGFENLDKIINSPYFNNIDGIVFGRSDFAESIQLNKDEVNSAKILDVAKEISQKIKLYNKDFIIGGNVTAESVEFFKQIPNTKFETRKIIFDSSSVNNPEIQTGIIKSLEFEILWLKYKQEKFNNLSNEDLKRIKSLETNCKALIQL